ncbi:unnamed protein product [Echinostoma caproni]|uniref:ANK_REP_REGION domain-containing protein n=1 Tax=Echinostoma caproni TaxID=27848 RepID=A0A183AR63_9TREM|nr:unnamed protein product [Echinostoma caproni]
MFPYDQASQIASAEEALITAFSWRCLATKVRERIADIRGYNRVGGPLVVHLELGSLVQLALFSVSRPFQISIIQLIHVELFSVRKSFVLFREPHFEQGSGPWQAWKDVESMSADQARSEYVSKLHEVDPSWDPKNNNSYCLAKTFSHQGQGHTDRTTSAGGVTMARCVCRAIARVFDKHIAPGAFIPILPNQMFTTGVSKGPKGTVYVSRMLMLDPEPNGSNSEDDRPIFNAVKNGDLEQVKRLIEQTPDVVNARDSEVRSIHANFRNKVHGQKYACIVSS